MPRRIDPWLTNGTAIEEEVVIPFHTVIWHVAGWDETNPIIYGDEHGMFIFDPERKRFHSLLYESYVTHDIVRTEVGNSMAAFVVRLTGLAGLTHQRNLTDDQWTTITTLTQSCPTARRWIIKKRSTL
ncbi:MAG: hypothetical protein COV60_03170 [Candidatus Magasanikbacteria bacterium CG11_big_fil_rev_8_21_14_0_20_43_7]|uniref:Uncharacterized protein n=1 Tax=Candidatus Magasanikbacteria bacterium CG11_big_fil_rev_8_21_14_0_20_43_7 TaxID=1974654 RepID=A0A2H0N474_9BACT|nr:MAG: hypothetical protein COV60_03170 [Candidatus Magasanikbacteria bacterium CG11_big_fil_rev_8_21_14_0_20_43_7]